MRSTPEELYLDLMKRALSFVLWLEPPVPIESANYRRSPAKRFLITAVSRLLRGRRLELVQHRELAADERIEGKVWPGYADTMIGLVRLDNLQFCVETVIRDRNRSLARRCMHLDARCTCRIWHRGSQSLCRGFI